MIETLEPGHYRLSGRLTMQDADAVTAILQLAESHLRHPVPIDLDVGGIETADSVLLAVLVHMARRVEKHHGILRLRGLSDSMRAVARTYGIDTLIEHYIVHASVHETPHKVTTA